MKTTSRRAVLAGIAAAPAIALPTLALAEPIVKSATDPRLLALRDKMRPLLIRYYRLSPKVRRAWRTAFDRAGYEKLPGPSRTEEQQQKADAIFRVARRQTGYSRMYPVWNGLHHRLLKLSKSALKIPSSNRIGDGIHAAAALHLNDDMQNGSEVKKLLCRMIADADMPIPMPIPGKFD